MKSNWNSLVTLIGGHKVPDNIMTRYIGEPELPFASMVLTENTDEHTCGYCTYPFACCGQAPHHISTTHCACIELVTESSHRRFCSRICWNRWIHRNGITKSEVKDKILSRSPWTTAQSLENILEAQMQAIHFAARPQFAAPSPIGMQIKCQCTV